MKQWHSWVLPVYMVSILVLIGVGMHLRMPLVPSACDQYTNPNHYPARAPYYDCAALDRFILRPIRTAVEYIINTVHKDRNDMAVWANMAVAALTGTLSWMTWRMVRIAYIQRVDSLRAIRAAETSAQTGLIQARTAETALHVVEAPYIFPIISGNFEEMMNFFSVLQNDIWDHHPRFDLRLKNFGRTPAIITSIVLRQSIGSCLPPKGIPLQWTQHTIPDNTALGAGEISEPVDNSVRIITHINREIFTRISSMNEYLWFYGRVNYKDVFGSNHILHFSWRYNAGVQALERGDEADNYIESHKADMQPDTESTQS